MSFASYRFPGCLHQRPSQATAPPAIVIAVVVALAVCGACRRRGPPPSGSTGRVEGRVTDLAKHPLADVIVEIGADPPDGRVPIAHARTTSAGDFAVDRVPTGRYGLTTRHPTHAPATAAVTVQAGGTARAELRLPPFAALEGRIEDAHGTPVPLAQVVAVAVGAPAMGSGAGANAASSVHKGRADPRGRFELGDLAPGLYRLLIEAPGLGTATAGPLTAPDPDVVVVLPGESRSITGIVTHAGHLVPAAHVHLGGETLSETRTTETDLAGGFAFPGIGPGAYAARAELGPLVSAVVSDIAVGSASALRHVELALGESVTFHGRVVDEEGRGVSNAAVRFDLVPPTGLWPIAETDGDGRWSSSAVGPGQYQLRPRRAGFTPRRTALVDVVRPGGTADPLPPAAVTLELARSGRIAGRVLGEDGRPVAGAQIRDRVAEIEELGVIWSALPSASEAAALPVGALPTTEGRGSARHAVSDRAGQFTLTDVPPGRLQLEVLEPASVPFRGTPVVLAPGQTLDAGVLRLAAAMRVDGRAVDDRGQPLPGTRITARTKGSTATDALYAVTDGAGAFSLPVAQGDVALLASASGHADVEVTLHVRPGGATAPVVLTFGRSTERALAGVVRDGAARPVAGARVLAFPHDPGSSAMDAEARAPAAATLTDPGGHFRFERLPAGPLWLEVRHASYPPQRELIDATAGPGSSADVKIQLLLPGEVWGEVHERITGAPVPRFEVEAVGPNGDTALYPAHGRRSEERRPDPFLFRLGPLAPGAWTIRARAPGYPPVERQVLVPASGTIGEPSVRDLRLELERRS